MHIVHRHGRHHIVSAMTYDTIHMLMMMKMMITDLLQLLSLQCLCAAGRHFAGTAMNEHSSRSHVIFRIVSHMYLLILSSHCCWFSSTCGNHFHGLKTALEGLGGDVNLDLARFVLNMPK